MIVYCRVSGSGVPMVIPNLSFEEMMILGEDSRVRRPIQSLAILAELFHNEAMRYKLSQMYAVVMRMKKLK